MQHSEFVRKYKNNEISVHIDKNAAGFFYQSKGFMPEHLRRKQTMTRAFGLGGLIGGAALFFFTKWYIALIVLVIGLSFFPKAQKKAAEGVLEASLEYPEIFEYASSNNVLRISEA
ncbi:hypothetical protein HNR65_003175 [Desulfosalsimonas propionicica]|uniref:Uncharacterized protein n=1 Tax=Desulfosalsimonas propionicica TaxID=332175 RepID=A0A7W0CBS6_9BACT|nr:hypothetical protein [Desulfosalsimonas propionicica]MBA2882820.1 hypothetical protein [Desulfosalsimonas propionicica]